MPCLFPTGNKAGCHLRMTLPLRGFTSLITFTSLMPARVLKLCALSYSLTPSTLRATNCLLLDLQTSISPHPFQVQSSSPPLVPSSSPCLSPDTQLGRGQLASVECIQWAWALQSLSGLVTPTLSCPHLGPTASLGPWSLFSSLPGLFRQKGSSSLLNPASLIIQGKLLYLGHIRKDNRS